MLDVGTGERVEVINYEEVFCLSVGISCTQELDEVKTHWLGLEKLEIDQSAAAAKEPQFLSSNPPVTSSL